MCTALGVPGPVWFSNQCSAECIHSPVCTLHGQAGTEHVCLRCKALGNSCHGGWHICARERETVSLWGLGVTLWSRWPWNWQTFHVSEGHRPGGERAKEGGVVMLQLLVTILTLDYSSRDSWEKHLCSAGRGRRAGLGLIVVSLGRAVQGRNCAPGPSRPMLANRADVSPCQLFLQQRQNHVSPIFPKCLLVLVL